MRVVLFYALLLLTVIYAFARGGRPEKIGATIFLIGTIATQLSWSDAADRLIGVEAGALTVDVVALASLVLLAIYTNRNWTLWLAALQVATTLAHLARIMDPTLLRTAYAFLMVAWSWLMLPVLALGVKGHQRREKRRCSPY